MAFCEECGAKLIAGTLFCEECGTRIPETAYSATGALQKPETTPRERLSKSPARDRKTPGQNKLMMGIVILAIIVIAGVGFAARGLIHHRNDSARQVRIEENRAAANDAQSAEKPDASVSQAQSDRVEDPMEKEEAVSSDPSCPPAMAHIPEGAFQMGSNGGDLDESPQHEAILPDYCIDKYEVTNQEFIEYEAGHQSFAGSSAGNQPVTKVSWNAAAGYCAAKNKRLCSEEEWEKACRGPNASVYTYGDQFDMWTCWTGQTGSESIRIGAYDACSNEYGVHDMTGNVSEWTAANYDPYPGGSWEGNMGNGYKVHRGGHWGADEKKSRCSQRGYITNADSGNNIVGFRCCSDTEQGL